MSLYFTCKYELHFMQTMINPGMVDMSSCDSSAQNSRSGIAFDFHSATFYHLVLTEKEIFLFVK